MLFLLIIVTILASSFYLCDCANISNFKIDNTVIPDSSIYKFQRSSTHLPDSEVKDYSFKLPPETTFVKVWEGTFREFETEDISLDLSE